MTLVQRNPISDPWSFAEPDPGVEPDHVFERRVRDRVDSVRAEAEAAKAAEAAASAQVDTVRGAVALGEADPKTLLRAQRQLAKLQEATAMAESAARAIERWEIQEREARVSVTRARSRAAYQEAQATARAVGLRAATAIRSFIYEIDEIEADIARLNARIRVRGRNHAIEPVLGDLRDELARRATNLERV